MIIKFFVAIFPSKIIKCYLNIRFSSFVFFKDMTMEITFHRGLIRLWSIVGRGRDSLCVDDELSKEKSLLSKLLKSSFPLSTLTSPLANITGGHATTGGESCHARGGDGARPPRLPRPRRAASPMSLLFSLLFIPLRVLTESLALPPPLIQQSISSLHRVTSNIFQPLLLFFFWICCSSRL